MENLEALINDSTVLSQERKDVYLQIYTFLPVNLQEKLGSALKNELELLGQKKEMGGAAQDESKTITGDDAKKIDAMIAAELKKYQAQEEAAEKDGAEELLGKLKDIA